ncbi:MAG: protein jag [Clostridia bacterium]|nr:protein jag [Clostridia bacterium]
MTTGKTVEEAVAAAVRELGAPNAESIQYEVLEEPKKGLFGIGAVPAKISASYTMSGAEVALEFVKNVISDMGLSASAVMTDGDNDDMLINIDGDGSGVLIGHHGETLDSLQYLANLAANKKVNGVKREHVKITLDAEGYRAKREEALRALARRMADKVLRYKKSVMLEPMNPYERRIIHSEVQGIEGVSTNSIGSENNRKVVMYLDDKGISAGKKSNKKSAPLVSEQELY